jgi:DNA-binding CsgD family transcriptional regulator/RecA/RadA recombinase
MSGDRRDHDVPRRWPVIDRTSTLAHIADVLDLARHCPVPEPTVRGVVIVGPAGIGKTTVMSRAIANARTAGFVVEHLVASASAADLPLFWLALLGPAVDSPRNQAALVAALAHAIERRSPDTPLVVGVDDVVNLPAADIELLSMLARRGLIFPVMTARESARGIGALRSQLADGSLARIDLGPLVADDLLDAASGFLGAPLEHRSAAELCRISGGVPLFAREFLAANLARGVICESNGAWRIGPGAVVPDTLLELVRQRAGDFSAVQDRYLEILAVAQPLPAGFHTEALGVDELAELEDAGVIVASEEHGTTVVRLAHPLYAEAILARSGPLRRREIAGRAVEALRFVPTRDPDRELRTASLCIDHDLPVDDEMAVAAAQRALQGFDPQLATRLVVRIERPSWESQFVLGAALAMSGDAAAADRALHAAFDLAESDEQRARATSRRVNCIGVGAGRLAEALAILDDATAAIADPRWRAHLAADRAYLLLAHGRRSDGMMGGAHAVGVARANECLVGAVIAAMAGKGEQTEELVAEGLTLVDHLVDVPNARELLTLSNVIWFAAAGRTGEARATVEAEIERAGGRDGVVGLWLATRAHHALLDGRPRAAIIDADAAIAEFADVDVAAMRPMSLGIRAVALAQLGQPGAARLTLADIDETWRHETKAQVLIDQAEAWILAGAGRTQHGARRCAQAATKALEGQHAVFAMCAAHDASRLGHPSVALPILRETARSIEGRLVHALLEHAIALDGSDAAALLALAEELPELGFTVSGAESAATAARILGREGRTPDASRANALAGHLMELVDVVRTPGLGTVVVVTEREREIGELASRRRRNREIAEQLGISVRTVDNHLASLYRKLGVSRRDELSQWFDGQPERPGGHVGQLPSGP